MTRRGDPRVVFEQMCEAGWPHTIVEVTREGFRRTRTVLCPLVALLACEPRQAAQIVNDDLPAEDENRGRSRLGARRLYAGGSRSVRAPPRNRRARRAMGTVQHPSGSAALYFLGHIVFRVEGGLAGNRMRWLLADKLRRQVDFECSGPDSPTRPKSSN